MAKKNILDIPVTGVFTRNAEAKTRFMVNEGGTGSSKTYSLCELFLKMMIDFKSRPTTFSIVRKTLPALRRTAMKDFFDILKANNIYEASAHNMSANTYRIGKSEVEFFSTDDEQKLRGGKRQYLWINEANELSLDEFTQLNIRTDKKVFFDYNPSEIVSWLYNHPAILADQTLIHSTFLDNPFLSTDKIQQIKMLKEQDEETWKVFGEGRRAQSRKTVYTNWDVVDSIPDYSDVIYGLDFGFNHPTALVRMVLRENEVWEEELIYEGMTNAALIVALQSLVPKSTPIYADSEAPDRIQEIFNAGFNIQSAHKGPGSVKAGIDLVRSKKVHILKTSTNLISEKQTYRYRTDKDGSLLDEPVKFKDDLMDAERYGLFTHSLREGVRVLFEA